MTELDSTDERPNRLVAHLRSIGSSAVAFSGGVDSAVVAAGLFRAFGPDALAITAVSPALQKRSIEIAREVARQIGLRHLELATDEFADSRYSANDGARCYYCKSELYDRIAEVRERLGFTTILSGANLDDAGDYRPGLAAAAERGVRHPLMELELRKDDVRAIARAWNLTNHDRPASPCLSSRVAPGLEVNPERVERIDRAEEFLRSLGLADVRVRLHPGELARIETQVEQISLLTCDQTRIRVDAEFKRLGFNFVSLDLSGLKSGGLNVLNPMELTAKFVPKP